jgi:uncharacterized membrane protein YgcG
MAFILPKLDRLIKMVQNDQTPTYTYHRWWQDFAKGIEQALNSLQDAIDAAAAAQAAADAANTAAANAQNAADAVTSDQALINSYVTGVTLTGVDTGSNAKVTVSTHTRNYADGTSVSVTGADVTGLSYSTLYYIYYDQASRAGGTVTYVATTSIATAAQLGDRHLVGSVTTPAAAAGNTSGLYVHPPGVGDIL